MKIIFLRHGFSEANQEEIFSNRNFDIHPLCVKGINQVKAVADELKSKIKESSLLYICSSPILRAKQTAKYIADAFGQDHFETLAIREFDVGNFEGTYYAESWQKYEQLANAWLNDQQRDVKMGGTGESYNDIVKRFVPFVLEELSQLLPQDAIVILVGHGGTYKCMMPEVLEGVDHYSTLDIRLGNAEYVIAETQGVGRKLKVTNGQYADRLNNKTIKMKPLATAVC